MGKHGNFDISRDGPILRLVNETTGEVVDGETVGVVDRAVADDNELGC